MLPPQWQTSTPMRRALGRPMPSLAPPGASSRTSECARVASSGLPRSGLAGAPRWSSLSFQLNSGSLPLMPAPCGRGHALEMGRDLGYRGTRVEDGVGDVLGARRRSGDEDAGDAGAARVQVLVRLQHVVLVGELELLVLEEHLDVAVGLDADRQDDHVVLGLDERPAVLDVLVAQDQVPVGLLGDLRDAPLYVRAAD